MKRRDLMTEDKDHYWIISRIFLYTAILPELILSRVSVGNNEKKDLKTCQMSPPKFLHRT